MNESALRSLLAEVLETEANTLASLDDAADLTEYGLTSIICIELILALEEAYSIEIDDEDLSVTKFNSIAKINRVLAHYLGEPQPVVEARPLKKVLVCDCDGVLWEGIAGEEPISFASTVPLHEKLLSLYEKGVLLCLCSRNTPANILLSLKQSPTPLTFRHFVSIRAEVTDKAQALRSIADELNLGLDSLVFLDDSDYELGLVEALVPEVSAVKAEDDFLPLLDALFADTAGDASRTEQYREQKNREKARKAAATAEEYNASLDTHVALSEAGRGDIPRLSELSQRTNQFNLSASRYTEDELSALLEDGNHLLMTLSVTDRYGDMGMIGAAVVRKGNPALIESFFLSCRAFGRGFEGLLLDGIRKRVDAPLIGVLVRTEKNKKHADFYRANGVMTND